MQGRMRWILGILAGCLAVAEVLTQSPWTWECKNKRCLKTIAEKGGNPKGLDRCRLTCGGQTLWPLPSGEVSISDDVVAIDTADIPINTQTTSCYVPLEEETAKLVKLAGNRMREAVKRKGHSGKGVHLEVTLLLKENRFTGFSLHQDEGYVLHISKNSKGNMNATIAARNFLGGRNGLETLGQLIVWDDGGEEMVIPKEVVIKDKPAYTYRGLLLDTSRSYISVQRILKTIDAMASTKLNSFHWHITDSQSFPFESESFPQLHKYGSYSPKKIYTREDIEKVRYYGLVRGVRVVPELDAPAHVGEGWQWAGDATVCFKAEPWKSYCVEPPCGQLNPTSEMMYKILEGIYKDMETAFQSDLFHMGGDEVNLNCWNTSQVVLEGMKKLGLGRTREDFHVLWSKFQDRALDILEKVSGKKRPIMIWTSSLTEKGHVDKFLDNSKYIIQIWTKEDDPIIAELVNKGFPVVLSNYDALYFDCGFGAWVGEGNNWCSPYTPWMKIYHNDPLNLVKKLGVKKEEAKKLVLGAEATLWTEQADDSAVDNRFWPRAAAMGERLWSGDAAGDWTEAEHRFLYHRQRLTEDGIIANTIQPEWCWQNQGYCYN